MLGIVFSGGGFKGCFQVGAIQALEEKNIKPDMVAGVSTGNLQAVMVAQGKHRELYQLWDTIEEKDIFKRKPLWFAGVLLGAKSVYDQRPLYEKIKRYVKAADFVIPFRTGAVCLEDGKYYTISEKSAHLHEYIYASASIPVVAESVTIDGKNYVDGGVRNITPLKEAVDFGCDQIIVVLCSPRQVEQVKQVSKKAIAVGSRALGIILNEIYNEDLAYAEKINNLVERGLGEGYRKIKLTIIEPEQEVIGTTEFNRPKLEAGKKYGYERAKKILGEGGY